MNIKRPLMPGWLKAAEQKLLLNKPGIWSTRIHLVLYYGILFILLLAALCFAEPVNVRSNSTTEFWVSFVSIISVIALTVWLIYLLRFNVFKKYGIIHPLHGLVTFVLYFMATGIIVFFTYVHPIVESIRANNAFGDEEIVQDINAMNVKIGQLEYQLFKMRWDYDTVALVKAELANRNEYYEQYDAATNTYRPKPPIAHLKLDSNAFHNRLDGADSLVKLGDSLYLVYETPPFVFVSAYRADDYTRQQAMGAFDIYHAVRSQSPPTPGAQAIIRKELGLLMEKYYFPKNWYDAPKIEANDGPFEIVEKKYRLGNIRGNISNILEKKYRWKRSFPESARIFYYVTLAITLLVFIFRHSTVRTFFMSLLTGVLLTIFTAFILGFTHADNITFFSMMIIYTILFFVGSLYAWRNKKRKLITGIWINLFVFLATLFPLMIVGWYYTFKRAEAADLDIDFDYQKFQLYFFYAEIGGALLLLILLAIYIHKLYRRWYSLPEE